MDLDAEYSQYYQQNNKIQYIGTFRFLFYTSYLFILRSILSTVISLSLYIFSSIFRTDHRGILMQNIYNIICRKTENIEIRIFHLLSTVSFLLLLHPTFLHYSCLLLSLFISLYPPLFVALLTGEF